MTTLRGRRRGLWLGAIALGLLAAAWLLTTGVTAQTPAAPATPPAPAVGPSSSAGGPASPGAAATPEATPFDLAALERSEEDQLAQRYAPVMYIKEQPAPCDTDGEQYLPAPVEVVFGDAGVTLRQAPQAAVVTAGVAGGDLYTRDDQHYIDLRGHPRTPGCDYETHFKQLMGDQRPVIYAHVATEPGQPGLALQYWFFYYFNEFNDKHEGDWEMIQLLFDDANTPLEALASAPTRVAFAQHSGGEPAGWEEARVDKEAGRPVVYVASGSHASFYGPGIWLGWGNNGAGLGCDITTEPSVRLDPEVRLIPSSITGPDDPFAWATFEGRWGQRDTWVYNGPRGPNLNERWSAPVSWQNGVDAGAVRLQTAEILGPAPTSVFCDLAAAGSDLLTLSQPYPWLVGGALTLIGGAIAGLAMITWPTLRAAWALYRRHLRLFALLTLVLAPFVIAVNLFFYAINRSPALGAWLGITEDAAVLQVVAAVSLLIQQGLITFVIGPATIYAVGELRVGRAPTLGRALGVAIRRFWPLVRTNLWLYGLIILLALTVVGLPWVLMWSVRWLFAAQAVVLEGDSGRAALRLSSDTVKHHWWRVALTNLSLSFLATAVGPVVGLALLIGFNAPQDILNTVSSALYAVAQPLATIGLTLLYLQLRPAAPAPARGAAPLPAAVPFEPAAPGMPSPTPAPAAPPAPA